MLFDYGVFNVFIAYLCKSVRALLEKWKNTIMREESKNEW